MRTAMQGRQVHPEAAERARAVRTFGIGLTTVTSVVSGALLVAYGVILYVGISMSRDGALAFLPILAAAAVLGCYLIAAPGVFGRITRSTTAAATGWWLAAVIVGYPALWVALGMTTQA